MMPPHPEVWGMRAASPHLVVVHRGLCPDVVLGGERWGFQLQGLRSWGLRAGRLQAE